MKKVSMVLAFSGATLIVAGLVSSFNRPTYGLKDTVKVELPNLTNTTISQSSPKSHVSIKELSLNNREVYVTGVIDEGNSPSIAKQILAYGKSEEPMTIIINSPGGSVFDGAEIISAIEAAKGPVNTLCVQLCASMAAMIHQYGTKRLMLNRAVLMFHPAAGGLMGTIDQMNSRLTLFKSFIGKMEQNVANRSHQSFESYKQKSVVELWLDAEDSVSGGYADAVVLVRGKDAGKLYQEYSPDMNSKRKTIPFIVPGVQPNVAVPVVPYVPKVNWF